MGVRNIEHDDLIQMIIDTAASYKTSRDSPKTTRAILDRDNLGIYKGEVYRRLSQSEDNRVHVEGLVDAVLEGRDPSEHVNVLLERLQPVPILKPKRRFAKV